MKTLATPFNHSTAMRVVAGQDGDRAREMCVESARDDYDAKYVFFLDDDVLVPAHALSRMVAAMDRNPDWDMLTGIYVAKWGSGEPMIRRDSDDGAAWDWKLHSYFPVDACGLGCAIIRTAAFERLAQPWFKYSRVIQPQQVQNESDDMFFCRKLKQAGATIMADGGVVCGHIDDDGHVWSMPEDCPAVANASQEERDQLLALG